MVYRLAILIFGFGSLAAMAQPVRVSTTQHFDFALGGTIRMKDSFGSLTVEGWDQPGVELTVVKSLHFGSESGQKGTQHLDAIRVAAERGSGTELTISTSRPKRILNVTLEYRIRAPRGSHFVINHGSGDVSLTGMTGDIEVTSRRGDIVLMLPELASYSIDAHTRFGLVTSDLAAAARRKLSPGENLTQGGTAASHRLVVRVRYGGIAIKEVPREAVTPSEL